MKIIRLIKLITGIIHDLEMFAGGISRNDVKTDSYDRKVLIAGFSKGNKDTKRKIECDQFGLTKMIAF